MSKTDYLAYYRLAQINFEEQNIKESLFNLVKVYESNSKYKTKKVLSAIGDIYFENQNYDKAQFYFKKIAKNFKDEDIKVKIGQCFEYQDKIKLAKKVYETVIVNNPSQWKAFYRLGWLMCKCKNIKEGIDNLNKARSLNMKSNEVKLRLAEAYLMDNQDFSQLTRNIKLAVELLKNILKQFPNNYQAQYTLAKALDMQGKYEGAIKIFENVINPKNELKNKDLFFWAMLYSKHGKHNKAIPIFEKLTLNKVKDQLKLQLYFLELATSYGINDEHEKSILVFLKIIKMNPLNEKANYRLGKILFKKQRYNEAIECFRRILSINKQFYTAHYYIGLIYQTQQFYKKAYISLKDCIEIQPEYSEAWKSIGDILFITSKYFKSIKSYKKAFKYNKEDIDALIGIGNCFQETGQMQKAIKIFNKVLEKKQSWEIYYCLGNCFYIEQQADKAIEQFQLSLQKNPDNSECWYNLGNALCIEKDFSEAIKAYKSAIEKDSTNSMAFYNLGNAYFMIQNYNLAIYNFEEAIKRKPENVEWKLYISEQYKNLKKFQKGLKHLLDAEELKPKNFKIRLKLGLMYAKVDQKDKAIKYLLGVKEENPKSSVIKFALSKLQQQQKQLMLKD